MTRGTSDAVKSGRKPELVALDIGFIKYDDNFVEEPSNRKSLDGMRLSPSKLGAIEAAKGENERLIEYLFPVLRFHTRWKELSGADFWYAFANADVDHSGYLIDYQQTETVPDRKAGEYMGKRKESTRLSARNVEYLKKVLEFCRDNQIELFLMKVPSLSENWSYDYDEQIREIAEPYEVTYVNFDLFSDEMGLDFATDSPDEGSHLNTLGAEKFSRYLAQYISEHYAVTDRSKDEKYRAVWDAKFDRYEADKLRAADR